MVAGAAAKSPAQVVALDMAEHKPALAQKCGATLTLDIASDDVVGAVRNLTGGYGADVYLEGSSRSARGCSCCASWAPSWGTASSAPT